MNSDLPSDTSSTTGSENKLPATHDPLTGLLNRTGATEYLSQITQSVSLDSLSVIAVEISRFGSMNDSIGPELGDKIIAMTAKRLQKIFPEAIMIARMHGDHFCLAFADDGDHDTAVIKLLDFTQRPFAVRGEVIVLSVRIGVAAAHCGATSASALLHAAEVALHRAKLQLNKVSYYNATMVEEARSTHRLENDLRISLVTNAAALHSAFAHDEFFLCYQPIISATTGRVHAFEALLRWNHPQKGIVPPAQFIPMAEEIGIMDVLGAWVLRRACADAASWPLLYDTLEPGVSVNVSPTQFTEPGMLDTILDNALNESGLAPERLKLEITETAATTNDLAERLIKLRTRGCRIALDDFGTGYSSLTRLHALPLDYLKIDQSFLRGWSDRDQSDSKRLERLTRSILALAEILELTPIVEGVETEEQISCLRAWGGDLMQGYVFSKPMPAHDVVDYLITHSKKERS